MRGQTLIDLIRSPKIVFTFLAALMVLTSVVLPSHATAADLPLAAGSPLTGIAFDDRPLLLPVQRNFQMAMLTASSQIGRSCGRMEAYGWRLSSTEQHRANIIFSNTVDRLRGLGYSVEAQTPSSVSKDITLFTADSSNRHFLFMWSAGEIGLVMVLCESSASPTGHMADMYNTTPATGTAPAPQEVIESKLGPAPVPTHRQQYNTEGFTPSGDWIGNYTCMRGYTGATMHIDKFKGEDFRGNIRFYSTAKNRRVPAGSYAIYGQYDRQSHRILINPGSWIEHPAGYYKTIIVGSFDPSERTFSGFFQGIMGCTSFEAKSDVRSIEVPSRKVTHKTAKKKVKPHSVSTPAAAPAAEASPSENPATPDEVIAPPETAAPAPQSSVAPPASSGIDLSNKPAIVPPTAPVPPAAVPTPAPTITTPVPQETKPAGTPTSALDRKYGQHLIVLAGDWPAGPSAPTLAPAPHFNVTVPTITAAPSYNVTAPQIAQAPNFNNNASTIGPAPIYNTSTPTVPPAPTYNTSATTTPSAPIYSTSPAQLRTTDYYNVTAPELPAAPTYSIYRAPGS